MSRLIYYLILIVIAQMSRKETMMEITKEEQEIIYNLFDDVNEKMGLGPLQLRILNRLGKE